MDISCIASPVKTTHGVVEHNRLLCDLCNQRLLHPVSVKCCESNFCLSCIRKEAKINNCCPSCSSEDLFLVEVSPVILNALELVKLE
eukprot:TRINITY_DN21118_c0_g1_i1.p1 TRINITY_DN21118_c0_g1~~TRINITY_DN21118_c0_g1_i1.p1  ORF type:complete len:87 (+),score=10.00 TRINITY_DN21118_c0_g1_i1:44-304(+)